MTRNIRPIIINFSIYPEYLTQFHTSFHSKVKVSGKVSVISYGMTLLFALNGPVNYEIYVQNIDFMFYANAPIIDFMFQLVIFCSICWFILLFLY